MAVCESLLVFLETRDAEVHCQLKQLEQHADREADPDPERAPDGRDEGGDGVPGRLRDGLHVVVLHTVDERKFSSPTSLQGGPHWQARSPMSYSTMILVTQSLSVLISK